MYENTNSENDEIKQYYLINDDGELETVDEPIKRRRKKINR